MNEPIKKQSDVPGNSIAGAVGSIISTPFIVLFVAIWTGTVSGPTNPAFWQQLSPLAIGVLVLALLIFRPTRRFIFKHLKRLAVWLLGIRVYGKRSRDALMEQGKDEALAEVKARNAAPSPFNITYKHRSPADGKDWFNWYDFNEMAGETLHITAPKNQIVMPKRDGATIPGDNASDPNSFSARVTDKGHLEGIDFRVEWTDEQGYPRWDFVHVGPTGQALQGVPTGVPGQMQYGEFLTNSNIRDRTLTVEWVSTGEVVGRLTPNGNAWNVEVGRREGRVKPEFMFQDHLGVASTPAEGVERLRRNAYKEDQEA
ncbi:hypothetical protein [Paenarthrobacter sp. A20]|uniref:hypothetical protein n=1 Tax=Paenarthrobacter sp. A20 TaxID=2817891 RepID=UPI0020A07BC5|nr:hypothetical protein [Paenarthrobacter sp. A20]MCP1415441.1 hypothetical protein [Paenarthrobacter sp. A20]